MLRRALAAVVRPSASQMQDLSLQIMAEEYTVGTQGCATVEEATRKHHARYEIRQAQIPEAADGPACKKGCDYCCHLRVSVAAHEIFTLVDHLQAMPDDERRAAIVAKLKGNAERVYAMGTEEHYGTPTRCAMLDDQGGCQVYEARPSSCRRYHSVSLKDCEDSFNSPKNLKSKIRLSSPHMVVNMAHYLGFRKILEERGFDTAQYELSTALDEALADPQACRQRYSEGKPAFVNAVMTQPAGAIT